MLCRGNKSTEEARDYSLKKMDSLLKVHDKAQNRHSKAVDGTVNMDDGM